MRAYRAFRKAIQWAYFCIIMMMFTFTLIIVLLLGEFTFDHQMAVLKGLLYILLFWVIAGGVMSIRVAYLKKQL